MLSFLGPFNVYANLLYFKNVYFNGESWVSRATPLKYLYKVYS